MLKEPTLDLSRRGITLIVTDAARDTLARDGYDPSFGARPLRRLIQRRIEDTLSDLWLSRAIADATAVTVDDAPEGSKPLQLEDNMMTDSSGCFAFSWV